MAADHTRVKARLSLQPGQVVTSAIVQGEIRYGLERLPVGKRRAILESKASTVLATLPIEPITQTTADIYGTIRGILSRGATMPVTTTYGSRQQPWRSAPFWSATTTCSS
jgi:predicted nucleic acid-binding protein